MKKALINISKIVLSAFMLSTAVSCGDDYSYTPLIEYSSDTAARVRFYHTALGSDGRPSSPASLNGVNFQVNYFLNNTKVTGIAVGTGSVPVGLPLGAVFPNNGNYALIEPGVQNVKVVSPAFKVATATGEVAVAAVERFAETITLEAGKAYSSFLVGYPNYSNFTLKDDLSVASDPTKAYLRFVNTIVNTPATGFDFYIFKNYPAVGSTAAFTKELIALKSITFKGGENVFLPFEPNISTDPSTYTVRIFNAGTVLTATPTPTPVASLTTFVPRPSRVYTVVSRGYVGGLNLITGGLPVPQPPATTTTFNFPSLTAYTNR